ncbi:MAG: hypothetical protein EA402_11265 [Planctomycetota bacterium]|nr:MAG: hypothetical protein EA402_11265 [Planctomycetota bacterium]
MLQIMTLSTWRATRLLIARLWWSGRHQLNLILRQQPLRGLTMAVVILLMWLGIGALVGLVLNYLSQPEFLPLKNRLMATLLAMFCFALFWLITFSHAILVWGALLRNQGAQFLAQLPLPARSLYWGASVEGGIFSSWAAMVLAVPLLLVLAQEAVDPWRFLPAAALSLIAFLACCLSLGSWLALLLAPLVEWVRRHLVITSVTVALLLGGFVMAGLLQWGAQRPDAGFLRATIGFLSFAEHPLLPPAWAAESLVSALRGDFAAWTWHVFLLVNLAAALAVGAETHCHYRLRPTLNRMAGASERGLRGQQRQAKAWPGLWPLPPAIGILVRKDLRLFRRDPAQILQFALYFGMLALYISLLPRFDQSFQFDAAWRPMISLLNLTAVAMALATFTGRFVFPLLGQEGKRLWLLALAPWPRHTIVSAKWTFAVIIGLPVCVGLVVSSGFLLELDPRMVAYQGLVAAAMVCGCSAMSLGLGALLADYREDDAGKVAAGYGGTINLLASLGFIALLLAGAAYPIFGAARMRFEYGIIWTLLISIVWTSAGLILARRAFAQARLSG